jgi:crotonobetainyl-CoA:carnitine CoA-transferase CaiB-like acyl-CoA transferase
MPPLPLADVGGGTYPAVLNILLALQERVRTGRGRHLDVSMSDNVLPFLYWALAGSAVGHAPVVNAELITGGSPRYRIYRTRDQRFIAAAPIEMQFWTAFCGAIGVPETATADEVARRIIEHSADEWMRTFDGKDVCCSIVASVEEALNNQHFIARNIFSRRVENDGCSILALPLPLVEPYRDPVGSRRSPPMPKSRSRTRNAAE